MRLQQELGNKSRDSVEFVLAVLRAYHGSKDLHPVLWDIVEMLDPEDELLDGVKVVIRSAGVVTGEHGSAKAVSARLEWMQSWEEDPREKVRLFAANFSRTLEQSFAWEMRRADQSVALRRLGLEE